MKMGEDNHVQEDRDAVACEWVGTTFYLYVDDPRRLRRSSIPAWIPFTIAIFLIFYAFLPFFLWISEAAMFPYYEAGDPVSRCFDTWEYFVYQFSPRLVSSCFAIFIATVLGHAGIKLFIEASG